MKRTALLFLVALAAGPLLAQVAGRPAQLEPRAAQLERRPAPADRRPGWAAYPNPVSDTYGGGGRATPIASEFPADWRRAMAGSVWNQTTTNKHFAHTFTFPSRAECCLMRSGTLVVRVKALQGGPANSSSAANDSIYVLSGGKVIASAKLYANRAVKKDDTAGVEFPLTEDHLADGRISFYVQDDSAVLSANLLVNGCCIGGGR